MNILFKMCIILVFIKKFNKWVIFFRTWNLQLLEAVNIWPLIWSSSWVQAFPNQDSITYQRISQSYYLFCTSFHCTLHSKQVYTSPLAQVHKSSLEKGVRRVKLGVSFSDASSWKHWKAPGSKGHTPGQLCGCKEVHAQSSLPWC